MTHRRLAWLLAGALLFSLSVATWAQRSGIYSADRRFRASGMASEENMLLAREAARITGEMELWIGLPYPAQNTLHILVQTSTHPAAAIIRAQGWEDGRFHQRLWIPAQKAQDAGSILEAVASLVLNAYAAPHTPQANRTGIGGEAPAWISTGLLQNIQPDLRARNGRWLRQERDAGRTLPLAEVIGLLYLPEGHWREKAYAAAAVEFLFPAGDPETWQTLFRRIGSGNPLTPAWLRQHIPALSQGKVEARWQAFLEKRGTLRSTLLFGEEDFSAEERLLNLLHFAPRQLVPTLASEEIPDTLFAPDLIDFRQQAWVSSAARQLAMQIRVMTPGSTIELQEVLSAYARYFDALQQAPTPKTAWWRRKPKIHPDTPEDDAAWERLLHTRWQEAEQLHQQYLMQQQVRTRYVDLFEHLPANREAEMTAPSPSSQRTPLQRYLDDFEQHQTR